MVTPLTEELARPAMFRGRLPFAFYVGEPGGGNGSYGHGVEVATRADKGVLRAWPRYGTIRAGADPEPLPIDGDGLLTEDALLVYRAASKHNDDATVSILGGAHGYSSVAFVREFEKNLFRLAREVDGLDAYQLLVPVPLRHRELGGHWTTTGTLDWDRVEVEAL